MSAQPEPSGNTARSASPMFTLLVSVSTLLVFIVVILSAYIRLADAGLGCSDWPACFGELGAHSGKSLAEGGPLLPPSAARTFHRVAATLLAFFVIGIVVSALRARRRGRAGVLLPLLVLALTVFLSVLGYVTPSPLVPAVTTGNVLGGMAMLALLWWIGQRAVPDRGAPLQAAARRLTPWARAGLAVVVLQITLGAWVSGSFAGPSCPALPGCGAPWASGENFARAYAPSRTLVVDAGGKVQTDESQRAVHMTHRLGALATLLYLGWLGIRARTAGERTRSAGNALLALLIVQVGLGLGGVAAGLPLLVVTAHNAGAALLLVAVTHLNERLVPRGQP